MSNFLFVFEDHTILKANHIVDSDKESVADGYMSVIRIQDLKELDNTGQWVDIRELRSNKETP